MSLINIKPSKAADIPYLIRLVLKFVFNENEMSLDEINLMKYSIVWWKEEVDRQKAKKIDKFNILPGDEITEPDPVELWLMKFGSILQKKANKDPILMRRIALFKEHNIDYRKVYKLPGAFTKETLEDAQRVLEKWNRQNPDLAF